MKNSHGRRKRFAAKLTAALLCACMLLGSRGMPAFAGKADLYCSQSAKDALGDEQLQDLVDLIVTSIEPQAVNLLIERFPCFKDGAENGELGRKIGLYIYYGSGDQDGINEHENVLPGAYAYVSGNTELEEGKSVFKYMICMDAEPLSTDSGSDHAVLNLEGPARIQLDTTFCHELFHAFMDDYNRVGMTGYAAVPGIPL